MSRIVVRNDDAYEVVVGWDPPLSTYYAMAFDKKQSGVIVLKATGASRIADVSTLAEVVADYAELDEQTLEQLVVDKEGPLLERLAGPRPFVSVPARTVQPADEMSYGRVADVEPGPGKSVRIYIDGLDEPLVRHMDDLVTIRGREP